MRKFMVFCLLLAAASYVALAQYGKGPAAQKQGTPYSITAKYIEACSCPLFCSCYFNSQPAHHGDRGHFCEFNNVLQIVKGNVGNVKLDGMKIWLTGDLGGDWSGGKAGWLAFAFEPTATKEQVDAATKLMAKLYPLEWQVLGIDTTTISMEYTANKAIARRGDGKGEVVLDRSELLVNSKGQPVVIQNLKYWGAKSNAGFTLYHSNHRYEGHGKKFQHRRANGFTIEITDSGTL